MNKIDPFSIILYVAFAFVIVILSILSVTNIWITFMMKSDVPMYSRPTWSVEETTTIATTKATTIEETTSEPQDTGVGLYGED